MKTTKSYILTILLILFVVLFVGYSFYVLANLSMIDYQNRDPSSEISSAGLILEGEGIEISDRFYIPKKDWKLTYEVLGRKSESFQQVGLVISVYSIDHNEIIETAVYEGIGSDNIVILHGPGYFYLDITGVNSFWKIKVSTS